MSYTVAALYKFITLDDYVDVQPKLLDVCLKNHVKGTLLLAKEGINGTIAGPDQGIHAVLDYLKSDQRLANLDYKLSYADSMPFFRMKVRLKKEIVTIGLPEVDPNDAVGQYVSPEEWNKLIQDPDVVLLDTRNDYEVDIGTFEGAVNPNTKTFREFPEYVENNLDPKKHKKVAMFCTGGIRCEKASSYMKKQGFEEVYHLKGGILKYLENIPEEKSLWNGDCFVFDQRIAVSHGLDESDYIQCHGCRHPLTPQETKSSDYKPGVHCPYCIDGLNEKSLSRRMERQKQMQLAKQRQHAHIGPEAETQISHKPNR